MQQCEHSVSFGTFVTKKLYVCIITLTRESHNTRAEGELQPAVQSSATANDYGIVEQHLPFLAQASAGYQKREIVQEDAPNVRHAKNVFTATKS